VRCSVLQCVAFLRNVLAVCCSVLQCVAVRCSALQCSAVVMFLRSVLAVCRSVLQCVAVCFSELQCVAVCCSVSQCVAGVSFLSSVRDLLDLVYPAEEMRHVTHTHEPCHSCICAMPHMRTHHGTLIDQRSSVPVLF